MSGESRLPDGLGGNPVWRSSRGVHRPAGPWTPTVHAFLKHLETEGFTGAPTALGIDESGREVVTFIQGEVLAAGPAWQAGSPTPWPPWARTEVCLVATARLLGRFHEAAATFEPPVAAAWRRHDVPALGADEVVCHGDIGPHNTVYRSGLPVAFIDWDTIRPSDPLVEFGTAAWKYVPLGDDRYFEVSAFPERPNLSRRLSTFARAYGLHDRAMVRWALQQAKQQSIHQLRYFPLTPAERAAEQQRIVSELQWLDGEVVALVADLD